MLIGMPFASTMGLAGSPVKPMVIPWLLNRNGQAITLNNKLKAAGVRTPAQIKPLVDKAKAAGDPLTFAMTFPPGTHAMWMRYWLASGGIHPDKDVSLITIPPPQMVANMKVDKMDGFCVGEPWNNRAIEDGIGFTAVTTQQMWKDHPEKVCAFTEEFATKNPKTVKAVLKALHLASVDLDKMENRPKFAEVIARPTYINCPPATILERLMGKYEYGDGRVEQDPNYMIFSNRNTNYPHQIYGKWWLTQFRRWGMVKGAPDYAGHSEACAPRRHLSRGDEGARRRGQGGRGTDDHAVRRHVRRQGSGEVRAIVPDPQHCLERRSHPRATETRRHRETNFGSVPLRLRGSSQLREVDIDETSSASAAAARRRRSRAPGLVGARA